MDLHAITFIETSVFTRQIAGLATDDELSALQRELIAQPEKGDVIEGTGGLRKVRMAAGGRGKRGGVRVIYFLASGEIIYFLLAWIKSTKQNLTDAEKSALRRLVRLLKGEIR